MMSRPLVVISENDVRKVAKEWGLTPPHPTDNKHWERLRRQIVNRLNCTEAIVDSLLATPKAEPEWSHNAVVRDCLQRAIKALEESE